MDMGEQHGRSIPHWRMFPKVPAMDGPDWIVQEHTECLPALSEEEAVGCLSIGSCIPFSRCPQPSELHMCSDLLIPPKTRFSWHQRIPGKWWHCQLTISLNRQGNFRSGHCWNQKNGWVRWESEHWLCLLWSTSQSCCGNGEGLWAARLLPHSCVFNKDS